MPRLITTFAVCFCYLTVASAANALGSDHIGPVDADKWPAGLKELANSRLRVHGYFVNCQDFFFYSGDTEQINRFLVDYAKLKATELEVVLHPGKKNAQSPWDEKPRDLPVDWALYASPFSIDQVTGHVKERGLGPFVTRVDVWLEGRIDLNKLEVPANVGVKSGGEIEDFVSRHRDKRKQSSCPWSVFGRVVDSVNMDPPE